MHFSSHASIRSLAIFRTVPSYAWLSIPDASWKWARYCGPVVIELIASRMFSDGKVRYSSFDMDIRDTTPLMATA
jgi:hypothetical protein